MEGRLMANVTMPVKFDETLGPVLCLSGPTKQFRWLALSGEEELQRHPAAFREGRDGWYYGGTVKGRVLQQAWSKSNGDLVWRDVEFG
jgi:hypothetical protein